LPKPKSKKGFSLPDPGMEFVFKKKKETIQTNGLFFFSAVTEMEQNFRVSVSFSCFQKG
jgi:hypothetical protein